MGFSSARNSQVSGTQQAMYMQALANQQQQQATQQSGAQARSDLIAGRDTAAQALRDAEAARVKAINEAQTQGVGALTDYYNQGIGFQQPYLGAGEMATNRLAALYGQGGEYTQGPTLDQLQMDPGYAFRRAEGERALNATLGASGMRGSGAALKAATRYGQDASSQEYQNAYNRFMANRQAVTQGLQGLYGGGLSAAGVATGLAGQTGANLANVYGQTGTQLSDIYGSTGSNLSNVYTGVGSQLANASQYTGNQMANIYGSHGQNMGQGYANLGNIYAQSAMAPTNLMASLGGQALQAAALYASGGLSGAGGAMRAATSAFGSPFPSSYNMSMYSPHR